MNEFGEIADAHTLSEFEKVAKAIAKMTAEEQARYQETNPIRIWMVAGPSEEHAIAISAN